MPSNVTTSITTHDVAIVRPGVRYSPQTRCASSYAVIAQPPVTAERAAELRRDPRHPG